MMDELRNYYNELVLGASTSINMPTLFYNQFLNLYDQSQVFAGPPLPLDNYIPSYAFDNIVFGGW